jgi:hypothetical protein
MAITFRNLKGEAITHPEMDTNLASYYLSSSVSGSTITFYQSGSNGLVVSSSLTLADITGSDTTYLAGAGLNLDTGPNTFLFRNSSGLSDNLITKWNTGSEQLENSIINDDGTQIYVNGKTNIIGDLYQSGSRVELNVAWPPAESEVHLLLTDPYMIDSRSYEYSAIAMEHFEEFPGYFHNSFRIYTQDSEDFNFGSYLNVGPIRTGMFLKPSGSSELGNISIQDLRDGNSLALMYATELQLGVFNGEVIIIGNPQASNYIEGLKNQITGSTYVANDIHFAGPVHDSLDSPGTDGYILASTVSGSVWIPNTDNTGSVNDALITLSASNGIIGGGSFTTDQSTPDIISFELTPGVVSGSSQIIVQDTAGNLSGSRIDGAVALAITASHAVTASYALNVTAPTWDTVLNKPSGLVSGSSQVNLSQAFGTASNAVSSSYAVTASHALNLKEGIDIVINSGSFNYISAPTASFGYIESITGSAKFIGDAFIVVNSNTPTERYSGISTFDSGSVNVTASFFFDAITNDWNYEYKNMGSVDYGVALFGPEYNTQGSPAYNTNNRLVKSDGQHHLNDSNISDNGTTVQVYSNIIVTGSVSGSTYYGDGSNLTGIVGTTYSAGTGLNLVGTTFNNTAPDQTVAITGQNITVNGSYPNFQLTGSLTDITSLNSKSGSWDTAYGWGDHSLAGYLTSYTETDPIFTAHTASSITGTQIGNWDTAYGWGDHSLAGYLTSYTETDTLQTVTTRGSSTSTTITAANFITTSDKRLKSDIKPIQEGLETIKKFVSYEYVKDGVQDAGFLAQEVQEAIPYSIGEREDGFLTMRDRPVLAHMHKAILELEARLAAIEEKLN